MKSILSYVFILLLFGLATPAFANPEVAARCDGCTALQAKSAATAIAFEYVPDPTAGPTYLGYVYVYDYTANTIQQYGVFLSGKQGGLTAVLIGAAPTAILNEFHVQTAALRGNGGNLVFTFTIPNGITLGCPDLWGPVYDVVQTSAYQNAIGTWLISNAQANTWNVVAAATGIVLQGQAITVEITLIEFDGSQIVMTWTAGQGNHFTLKSAEDPNGNSVPLVAANAPGHYIFNNGSGDGHTANEFGLYMNERFQYGTVGAQCVNGQMACVSANGVNTCSWVHCF